ncbi:hypothetical protein EJ08DRAFT_658204 [Tothia fuscella]|uniref:Zn(2)-C6 fungal-type domain-containing protein n=1 Tax=Tothia fuscella TaxID=1048955 RepID=A0A9P4NX56_9PEZI|nr:hypothetical protein EJ08DRAFT_658204 [Tothia fuscella]
MPPDRSSPESGSGSRKKMRKGTHSCFECRRRKIRCIFPPDNPNSCTECFARGSRCVDQEHAETDIVVDHRKNLRERVARLEALVETLVDDKTYDKSEKHAAEALRSLGGEFPLTPHSEDTPSSAGPGGGHAPILSLFNNDVITKAEGSDSLAMGRPPYVDMNLPQIPTITYTPQVSDRDPTSAAARQKDERTRQALMSVLPNWEKLRVILRGNHHAWAVFERKCPGTREAGGIEQFAHKSLTNGGPQMLGLLVLLYGSCIEGDILDRCLALVDRWILQDDDYMGTLEGLECALLQGKSYADIGQARRSWLCFRRALTHAQLMGLHKNHAMSIPRETIWWSIYGADRLTSLMLGMPYGIQDAHCNLDFMGQHIGKSSHPLSFFAKIAYFAGKVVDRSQSLNEATYSSALDLEQELNEFAGFMPPGWWDANPPTPSDDPNVSYEWQEKVLGQMAFQQIKAYLHMPFMLKSAVNAGYDNSRIACIDGSREMLRLYHMLRAEGTPLYECKAVDFVGFTACIFLVLGLLGYGRKNNIDPSQAEGDWILIERSMDIFKRASCEKGGKVAAQSYEALAQLHEAKRLDCVGPNPSPNQTTKIVIPFFGTISIQRGQSFRHFASPGGGTPNCLSTPASKSITTSSTPSLGDISSQAGARLSTMDPQIMYDGFYMPQSAFDPQLADETLASYMSAPGAAAGAAFNWPNTMGNMDIDQDWNWFMSDIQLQQGAQQQYGQQVPAPVWAVPK